MKIFVSLVTTGFAVLVIIAPASAATRLSIVQSTLTLHGTSTVHNFECTTTNIQGSGDFDTQEKSAVGATITIPVKSIHSKSTSMDNNMYKALKADDNPAITFSLLPTVKTAGKSNDSLSIKGDLTIAGKTRIIEMRVSVKGPEKGAYLLRGSYDLLMTDYGVAPPTFMFGAMKTGPKISIQFELKLAAK